MPLSSLSGRLLLTSLGWSVFALVATGVVLTSAFRQSVEERFDDTLTVYLSVLIGQLAETAPQSFRAAPVDLGDPRFVLPLSGWYWIVSDTGTRETVASSRSLAGDVLQIPETAREVRPGQLFQDYVTGPAGEQLRLAGRRVAFEDGRWVLVVVAGASSAIEEDTEAFMVRAAAFLGIFAAILVGGTFVQWRVGLRPLLTLGAELQAIREGRSRSVGTRYPTEIVPVAEALNALIESNQKTLERARQHVGNLAHALKTPISVLVNDAAREEGPLARSVSEQTQIMQRQVRYYLERAQMAARERVIGTVTDVGPALSRLHRAMSRLGAARGIDVAFGGAEGVRFAGEQQDLEEIVGNLVDNALKWSASEVRIEVAVLRAPPEGMTGPAFLVAIEDDGPGLSEDQLREAIARGRRLDTSKPGSGLGLSIVAEIVELYGGNFRLARSELGGLRAEVCLPRA